MTTVTKSGSGAAKESIASIKLNAPIAFATQQRLVTAEDYKALVLQRHSDTVEDVSSWGGNENVPAQYGKVYLSLKFKDDVSSATQTAVKDSIKLNLTDNLAIMSIDTVFVDPTDTFLEITTSFNFDPDLTGVSIESMQTSVTNEISKFFTDNLNKFGQVFRRSALSAKIDDLSVAILNSAMEIKAQQRWSPTLNVSETHTIAFPIKLATADDVNRRITSTSFTSSGQTCTIRNVLSSTKLELVNALTNAVVKDNVGSYDPNTGVVTLTGFQVSGYNSSGTSIKISAVPADQGTIRPLRNHILKFDTDKSTATGTLDFQVRQRLFHESFPKNNGRRDPILTTSKTGGITFLF